MKLDAFDYTLPIQMIAASPAAPRGAARLLDLSSNDLIDRLVKDLPLLLRAGDVLVVNNTEVIPAHLKGRRDESKISFTLHKREEWIAHRDFRPIEPLEDTCLIKINTHDANVAAE